MTTAVAEAAAEATTVAVETVVASAEAAVEAAEQRAEAAEAARDAVADAAVRDNIVRRVEEIWSRVETCAGNVAALEMRQVSQEQTLQEVQTQLSTILASLSLLQSQMETLSIPAQSQPHVTRTTETTETTAVTPANQSAGDVPAAASTRASRFRLT